jgi:coenzyme Q-binding protein COQ10
MLSCPGDFEKAVVVTNASACQQGEQMPVHRESRVLPYRRDQFFDLVADVESYPLFVPLWWSAEIYQRDGDVYYTEQEIGVGFFMRERFHSRTQLTRPTDIEITSDDSIFDHFRIHWHFESPSEETCRVDLELSCEARSMIMHSLMELMMDETARNMVTAFEARARQIYGTDER